MSPDAVQHPMRILVVDDDELDRLALRRCLQEATIAATIEETPSAEVALERARQSVYDCILLDYYMPGVDTVSLLRQLQTLASDVPVVIFTGRGDEEVAVEFMKLGAVDYLPKSALTPERLAASLRYAIDTARATQERRRVEQALHAREAEFRTLANVIPQMAWIADAQGRRYWCNDRWYEYTGLRKDESLGLGWLSLHHPDHFERVRTGQLEAFSRGEAWEDTFPLRGKDGSYRWFLARAVPIRSEESGFPRWFGTHTDITDQKHAELERERLLDLEKRAREEAEQAARARDEVLAIVAHDVRNPLQTILSAISMLSLTSDEEKRQRALDIARRSTQELQRLTSDLLDVARIDAGTFAIRQERVDFRALLHEAIERVDPQALDRGIALDCRIEEDVRNASVDRDRLLQVLSNLLGNALKFTSTGGRVVLRAERHGAELQVCVEDSGIGIPAESLPHVFARFWQADRASRSGAGLGLAICKGIVEAHGGRIWATSVVGKGACFYFTLPRVDA